MIAVSAKRAVVFTYAKALSFLLPPTVVFAVAAVFVLPKIQKMCADVGYDSSAVFRPVGFVVDQKWILLAVMAMGLFALERWLPIWPRYRGFVIGLFVFLVNSAVLVELVCFLVVATLVGPQMHQLR